jgi:VIT1/CCC1 family predicted Fe2+/Mn2+ transporter
VSAAEVRRQAVFGGADGLVLALGFVVSFAGQPHAVVRAAVAAGLAEFTGMTAGAWLSDSGSGLRPALANGGAALAACVLPALPYVAAAGPGALAVSLVLVAAIAAVIARLRPEKGLLAVVQTFGVLLTAAALCWAASLI